MGCCIKGLGVSVVAIAILLCYFFPELYRDEKAPKLPDGYFGKGPVPKDPLKFPKDSPEIKKFKIQVDDAVLKDLKTRLTNTRYVEPLENVEFQYGFRATKLKEVVDYWKTTYDWRKQEAELNKFNHFKTQIEGIDVHFIRQTPDLKKGKIRVLPLLLAHGWPGSIAEFTKIIPLLTTARPDRDYVFEVICPSIPGFGFSEAPHQSGFSPSAAARIYAKLMTRLGFEKFYMHGSGFGSVIVSTLAKVYPERVIGLHLNMVTEKGNIVIFAKFALGYYLGTYVMTQAEYNKIYPISSYIKNIVFGEMAWVLLHATKPDTVGAALSDSPAGLAAYILEKFSTWTDMDNRGLADGGLSKTFSLDDLLTNVMVYWVTNTPASSMRFYKEMFSENELNYNLKEVPVTVPVGIAAFPTDLFYFTKFLYQTRIRNIVRYEVMPRGGHFAAMHEPQLLADEVWNFVIDIENISKK